MVLKKVYAFIDSQNVNLGARDAGWKVDFSKLRRFLKDRYRIEKAYLFIGYVVGNEQLYQYLQESGYICVFKPTVNYRKDGKASVKGNVDAELVLHASARVFDEYDEAIIASGDGDFHCLYEYLVEKGKLGKILIPNSHGYSSLIRKFAPYFEYLDQHKGKIGR
jgi:uncharacterized LabA/DUF88 family protein